MLEAKFDLKFVTYLGYKSEMSPFFGATKTSSKMCISRTPNLDISAPIKSKNSHAVFVLL